MYIVDAIRTPVGAYLGSLKDSEAQDLAALVMKALIDRNGLAVDDVDEVIFGEVYGYTPNVARTGSLLAGLAETTPAYTLDRQCASSLQAVINGDRLIRTEEADIVLAGGVEVMSRMLYYLDPSARAHPLRIGNKTLYDAFAHGVTLCQPQTLYPNLNMGLTAEKIAKRYMITRQVQDDYAYQSTTKLLHAQDQGWLTEEIVPVPIKQGKETAMFSQDEHVRRDTSPERLARLRPVFDEQGSVTAGNSSGMNDGASAVLLMSEAEVSKRQLKPLARIVASAAIGLDPTVMGLGPVYAIEKVLQRANLTLEDIGLFEINEAFAAQTLGCLHLLGVLDQPELMARINIYGGAIAHGHAIGNSGTRILTTLLYAMKRNDVRYGIASLCIGGGQGLALLVENPQGTNHA